MRMLEGAKRAVAGNRGCDGYYNYLNSCSLLGCSCKSAARATIRSIREPDEEVIDAMVTAAAASGAESVQEMVVAIWQDKITEDRG